MDDLRGQACAIPRSVSPCFVTSRNRWTVFENYRSDGTLQKIARQFHTSPFSLWYRDGGQKKGGRSRKARKAFRTNYRRTVGAAKREKEKEHPGYRSGGSPKTNYSDKPNYLPLSPLSFSHLLHKKRTGCYEVLDLAPVGSQADVARPINVYILHTRSRL